MTKLFVSYHPNDSENVNKLTAQLKVLTQADGQRRYDIWQDVTSSPLREERWQANVQAIGACNVFVFMISVSSVSSARCRAELSYAFKRNRPIIPVVLPGEYEVSSVTESYEFAYADDILQDLKKFNFLYCKPISFMVQFNAAVDYLARKKWPDRSADAPEIPRYADEAAHNPALVYQRACHIAHTGQLDAAQSWFQQLRQDASFATMARAWLQVLRDYQKILRLEARHGSPQNVSRLWQEYVEQYPQPLLDENGFFDPNGLSQKYEGYAHDDPDTGLGAAAES